MRERVEKVDVLGWKKSLSDKEKRRTKLNLPLHMTLAGIRDYLVGDMNPLVGMPSSLVEEARGSLEWSCIPRPSGSVMMHKIEENKQKSISAQGTPREDQKLWRLL